MARSIPPRLFSCLGVAIVVMVAAVSVVFGAMAVFANRQAGALQRPAGLGGYVKPESLDASILLRTLAGMPDQQVAAYLLAAGRNESSFAILAFADSLSDPERVNMLLTLAPGFAAAGDSEKATICYGVLSNLATLSSDFHDYQKANLLLQAGDGLAALGRRDAAEESYDRAQELARFSPAVLPSIRIQLLASLSGKYSALGLTGKAQDAARAAQSPAPSLVNETAVVALPSPPAIWQGEAGPALLMTAQMDRLQAAIELISAMEARPQGDIEAKRLALEQRLLAEDAAQDLYYTGQMRQTAALSARLAISQQRVTWLTLKWRVASRGYGVSLVPEWEGKLRDIEAALRRSLEDHYTMHLEMAALLPDALAARQAVLDALVEELKMSRLGLYPNAPEKGLAGDLAAAIRDRIDVRDDNTLYIVAASHTGSTEIGFAFATTDQLLRRGP